MFQRLLFNISNHSLAFHCSRFQIQVFSSSSSRLLSSL